MLSFISYESYRLALTNCSSLEKLYCNNIVFLDRYSHMYKRSLLWKYRTKEDK